MYTEQYQWTSKKGWQPALTTQLGEKAQLVFCFGSTGIIKEKQQFDIIKHMYPKAHLIGCTTSGEIAGTSVCDDSLVITAVQFEKTSLRFGKVKINNASETYQGAEALAKQFDHQDLKHLFVLSEGLSVNGSELVKGIADHLPTHVAVTGGLSGDGARFSETYMVTNGEVERNTVAAVGFYGQHLKVGYGSLGGWDPFGPERIVTRSKGNILYELDGKSALELYKKYLGEHAAGLPATGLLFPLSLLSGDQQSGVVRTILAVDEKEQSLTFAGDIPQGAKVRLMKANFDRLIDGAVGAAQNSHVPLAASSSQLAILISCVGRKLILKQRVEEEVEGVREVLGQQAVLTGFYSYGEISPFTPNAKCELHNQTMTITILSEK